LTRSRIITGERLWSLISPTNFCGACSAVRIHENTPEAATMMKIFAESTAVSRVIVHTCAQLSSR